MSPVINNSEEFSQCSLQQMQPEVNSASCLTAIDPTNTDPSVTILSPQDSAILSVTNPIPFVGQATDLEDGDLSNQIEWTSDLDGPIGTGGNISPSLSIGTHQITAVVEDTDNSQASEVIIITVAEGLDGLILFESHFNNNGTDGFSYVDDAFRNTNEPTFADGTHEPDQGFSGGGLSVGLGGINDADITNMSGGWVRPFNLDTSGEVTVAFRYKLTQASNYENDELSQTLLAIDGTLVGSNNNDYLAQLVGNGNGGSAHTTDWVPVVVNLGVLTSGPHTLAVGAYNNKKTFPDETTEVLIDDVVVRHTASGPPPPSNDPTVSITSPTDGDAFSDGTSIAFAGQAADDEDGSLTAEIVWTSDQDGPIGAGGSFSSNLSIGSHRITASVTDSDGNSTMNSINITVTNGNGDTILLESHFDSGADGFSYADDAFRNTNEPTFANGTHEPDQGFSGGGLRVILGGINDDDITDMSGGWVRSFTVDTSSEVTVALRYKLTQASDYENDELSQALVAVDGTLFGSNGNDYLAQLVGDGNGGSAQTTDWVSVVVNVGVLTAGPHTLTIGPYNNKKTFPDETTEVLIDDVVIRSTNPSPPPPNNEPILFESHFDSGAEGFSYLDDAFRNTNEPTFADGTHEPDQGFSGGGLRVILGGINDDDITDMSGGWTQSFTLAAPRELTLTFRYNLTQNGNFESDEYSEALLAVNGQLRGNGPNQSLALITGKGDGNPDQFTGWTLVTEDLGTLPAGTHTLTIGGFNNKKTFNNEVTEILFDDVILR